MGRLRGGGPRQWATTHAEINFHFISVFPNSSKKKIQRLRPTIESYIAIEGCAPKSPPPQYFPPLEAPGTPFPPCRYLKNSDTRNPTEALPHKPSPPAQRTLLLPPESPQGLPLLKRAQIAQILTVVNTVKFFPHKRDLPNCFPDTSTLPKVVGPFLTPKTSATVGSAAGPDQREAPSPSGRPSRAPTEPPNPVPNPYHPPTIPDA